MKIKLVPSIIALAFCALIAFGIYSWCLCKDMQLLLAIAGGLSIFLTLGTVFGVSMEDSRTLVNIKVVSGIFAAALIISNLIFCFSASFSLPAYVIVNGALLLIWLMIVYGLSRVMK